MSNQGPALGMTRRDFFKGSAGTVAGVGLGAWTLGCSTGTQTVNQTASGVYTTAQLQILPIPLTAETTPINPSDLPLYGTYGYSSYTVGPGLPYVTRADLAPAYSGAPVAASLLSFFAITDVHIADKESPAQPLYIGWSASYGPSSAGLSSVYSPILLSTTHVLDAAVRTINALHQISPFDFGICLGDATNNTQYNELRWFIDVMDGKTITPSSGAHLGAGTIDYQKPYQAAGLAPGIPWYQVVGNHDQFWCGSAYENAKTMQAHVAATVLDMGDSPNPAADAVDQSGYYGGVIDGSDPFGRVILSGPDSGFAAPPVVAADADRHTLATSTSTTMNFIREFFNTSSTPVGHGFNLVDPAQAADFACYSFVPKPGIPVKVIVLDDTVKGPGQPSYALGGMDATRLAWLENELQAGQANNQLMVIAAHIPLSPQNSFTDPTIFPFFRIPPYTEAALLAVLHAYPNLILWIAGHRHVNVVTPQADPGGDSTRSFWEVETASLRDFPQQFRTFAIDRNTDGTISITVTNVDPAVIPGSPAAKSKGYAIGASRIFGATPASIQDPTSHAYNAVLIMQLSPAMQAVIRNL